MVQLDVAYSESRVRLLESIGGLDWSGEPKPYLGLLPAYGEREDDLIETPIGL